MNKDTLDYLFVTGLVNASLEGNDPDIEDNEIIRVHPKFILQSAKLEGCGQDFINDYMMYVDALDLKEEFMSKIETGIDLPFKTYKLLMNNRNLRCNQTFNLLSLILYYTIKETPGAIERINDDFIGLLKDTAYKIEMHDFKFYTEKISRTITYAPFKISFDKSLIEGRYDDKLLNSEVVYSTFTRDYEKEYRYIPLKLLGQNIQGIYITVEEPLI